MQTFKHSFKTQFFENENGGFEITAAEYLIGVGAKIPVTVSISQSLTDELKAFGNQPLRPVDVFALIDTGAKFSCIDNDLAMQMQLPVEYETKVATPSLAEAPADVYSDAVIEIKNSNGIIFHTPNGLTGSILQEFNIGILLGRDFLAECRLVYDGPKGEFTITSK